MKREGIENRGEEQRGGREEGMGRSSEKEKGTAETRTEQKQGGREWGATKQQVEVNNS
jgi:hypothetical protein